jgi:chorismate mutase/prephenate dehydratase
MTAVEKERGSLDPSAILDRRYNGKQAALPRAGIACLNRGPMAAKIISTFRLGYFGRAGSFSHVAAARRFPKAQLSECPTVEEAFAQLQGGGFSHILVPIENASSGIITNTADQLMRLAKTAASDSLKIREALAMRVELALLARPGTKEISKIYSHRAPFDHGRDWLARHYPRAEQIIVESTSEAAALAAKQPGTAAIAGLQAVGQNGLKVVSKTVGSEVANQTTFVVVGPALARTSRPTHTSIVFELPHQPGSLVAVMNVLARRQLNLTKILSRPIPGRFSEYRFMIEFQGAASSVPAVAALKRIAKITDFLSVIGSYPVRRI